MSRAASDKQRRRAECLSFRVEPSVKALIERAAQIERRTLADYCVTAITEAAWRTIARHETLQLSERDRIVFFGAPVNPPEPNERLRRAFSEHRHRIGG